MAVDTAIETPCTRVCMVHPALALCLGCGRSLDEIARWMTLSADERSQIIAQLPPRLQAMAAAAPAAATA